MAIRILPPDIQQKIAAGEIVERPASVVKELIENALDAAADTIRVEIQEGGRRLVKVTDTGVGIAESDMRFACERFAREHPVSYIPSYESLAVTKGPQAQPVDDLPPLPDEVH